MRNIQPKPGKAVVTSACIDCDGLIDRADDKLRRRRVREFQALIDGFQSDRASGEPPPRQLARHIQAAAAGWR